MSEVKIIDLDNFSMEDVKSSIQVETQGQLTASISSSSSSMVDTVTELNFPIFFVCLVTNTLRGP